MAFREILVYPDSRLRKIASPVDRVDDEVLTLVEDMFETMYAAPGIGLAATQLNVHKRVIVIDISENRDQPHVFINPEVLHKEGELETQEGCLSVPEYFETVKRAKNIRVRALDRNGDRFELDADELLSVCIQHEIDHLEGKLFVDYLSALKRDRIRRKLIKELRST